jgi:hypothetical protein
LTTARNAPPEPPLSEKDTHVLTATAPGQPARPPKLLEQTEAALRDAGRTLALTRQPRTRRGDHFAPGKIGEVDAAEAGRLAALLADILDPVAEMISSMRACLQRADMGPLDACDETSSGQRRLLSVLLDAFCAAHNTIAALRHASSPMVHQDRPEHLPTLDDYSPHLTRAETNAPLALVDEEGRLRGKLKVPDQFGAYAISPPPLNTTDFLSGELLTREGVPVRVGPVMMGVHEVGRVHVWADAAGVLYVKGRVDRALTGPGPVHVNPPHLLRAGTGWGEQALGGVSVRRDQAPVPSWGRGDWREGYSVPVGDSAGAPWEAAGNLVGDVAHLRVYCEEATALLSRLRAGVLHAAAGALRELPWDHPAGDRPGERAIHDQIHAAATVRDNQPRRDLGDHLAMAVSTLDRAHKTLARTPHTLSTRTKGRPA